MPHSSAPLIVIALASEWISSTKHFLETLNGTHVVMSYGDWSAQLADCAWLLGLRATGTAN